MLPGKFGDLMTNLDTFRAFYKGKRVLLTGHTGFKGSWLAIWLYELGAEVIGVSLEPYTERIILYCRGWKADSGFKGRYSGWRKNEADFSAIPA